MHWGLLDRLFHFHRVFRDLFVIKNAKLINPQGFENPEDLIL